MGWNSSHVDSLCKWQQNSLMFYYLPLNGQGNKSGMEEILVYADFICFLIQSLIRWDVCVSITVINQHNWSV